MQDTAYKRKCLVFSVMLKQTETYTLNTKSGVIATVGTSNNPNQNTADVNNIMYMPAITLPTGKTGQKLL